jgi:hypothetical protein
MAAARTFSRNRDDPGRLRVADCSVVLGILDCLDDKKESLSTFQAAVCFGSLHFRRLGALATLPLVHRQHGWMV